MMASGYLNKFLSLFGWKLTRSLPPSAVGNGFFSGNADVGSVLNDIRRSIIRSQIAAKWSSIDFILKKLPRNESERICPLCEFVAPISQFGRVRSHCIFGGGDLLRYICPSCEVIFGPDKMFDLTAAELSEDYDWHYQVFEEGDSTDRELRAFFSLKPKKNGVYLNYGAGGWSSSVQQLRADGWNVYAYEPHCAGASQDEWLIDSPEKLKSMRFDGIFSNNVLEHFRNPVDELLKMSFLLESGGLMAHATPCFDYLYEFTRFHLFFFTGKSKDILMERAQLQLLEEEIDGDFMCRVMKPKELSEYDV